MQTACFQSPLGITEIQGDGNGVSSISILDV